MATKSISKGKLKIVRIVPKPTFPIIYDSNIKKLKKLEKLDPKSIVQMLKQTKEEQGKQIKNPMYIAFKQYLDSKYNDYKQNISGFEYTIRKLNPKLYNLDKTYNNLYAIITDKGVHIVSSAENSTEIHTFATDMHIPLSSEHKHSSPQQSTPIDCGKDLFILYDNLAKPANAYQALDEANNIRHMQAYNIYCNTKKNDYEDIVLPGRDEGFIYRIKRVISTYSLDEGGNQYHFNNDIFMAARNIDLGDEVIQNLITELSALNKEAKKDIYLIGTYDIIPGENVHKTDKFKTVHFISESDEALDCLQQALQQFIQEKFQGQNQLFNKWLDDIDPAAPLAPAMQKGVSAMQKGVSAAVSSAQHAMAQGKKRKSKKSRKRKSKKSKKSKKSRKFKKSRKSRKFKKSRKPKSRTRRR